MVTTTETTATKATPKRTPRKPAAAKSTSATTRRSPRTSVKALSSSATEALQNVPQWVKIGASITGAAVAIGATLFATRNEWLPRARKFGDWVEESVGDQLDNLQTVKSNAVDAVKARTGKADDAPTPVGAANFKPSGADASAVIN